MNIGEASNLNRLLDYILGFDDVTSEPEARAAAMFLADKAHKALSAGLTARQIELRWHAVKPQRPPLG